MSLERRVTRLAKRTIAPDSAAKIFLTKSLRSLSKEQLRQANDALAGPCVHRETPVLFMLNCRVNWAALRCCRCGMLTRSELPELLGAGSTMAAWEFPGGLPAGTWAKGWASDLQSWIHLFVRRHQDCAAVAAENWPTPTPGHLPDWGHARVVCRLNQDESPKPLPSDDFIDEEKG